MQVLRSDLRYVEVKMLLVKLSFLAFLLMLHFFPSYIFVVSVELINNWTAFALTQVTFYLVHFCTLAILKKFCSLNARSSQWVYIFQTGGVRCVPIFTVVSNVCAM